MSDLKPVPGFEGYLVDADGNIYSTRKNRFTKMKPVVDKHGYMRLHIPPSVGAKRKNVFVHTLVALAWHGEPEPGRGQINHKNSARSDNRPENLEWVSHVENLRECWRRNRVNRTGERHHCARLSDETVRTIREMRRSGIKRREIVASLGLPLSAVKGVLRERSRLA